MASSHSSKPHEPSSVGKVYLIGAGPGDPGLITLRGAELLARADVVLYDGLVDEALLQHASPQAECLCVGKHGHGGMWTQKQIDEKIVGYAKQGKCVARLKGGDTAVFARTAEEVDRLIEEAIPYEIVPGITAALAVSAYTGIPITHRDWSSAVALVTAQLQPADGSNDADESLDWEALAKFPGTLVLYMGVTTAGYWSKQLINAGKSPSTPVALVRRCTWSDQQIIRCELGNVVSTIASIPGLRPPIISLIGDVIHMARTMDWFSKRPWFGKRIWITSPERTARELAQKFTELGAQTYVQPVMQIGSPETWNQVDPCLRHLFQYDWIVFSSAIGVDAFFDRLRALRMDGRAFGEAKLAAVGAGTAAAIDRHGMICDLVPADRGIDAVAELLVTQAAQRRFLFVRNPSGETSGMQRIAEAGGVVDIADVYRQVNVESLPVSFEEMMKKNPVHAVTATSRNIASRAIELLGEKSRTICWLSLTPTITEHLRNLGCQNIRTASQPSFEALAALFQTEVAQGDA